MTIHCPHCLTGYELPRSLMGEHGARVRCPACQGVFVVLPEGEEAEAPAPAEPAREVRPESASQAASGSGSATAGAETPANGVEVSPPYEPAVVADAVLDVMVDFLGDSLRRARERGTVLSVHGPAIVAVWEEYRRRAGKDAPASEFRRALKERVGVDLTPRA